MAPVGNGPLRLVATVALVGLHVGFILTMAIIFFPYASLVCLLPLTAETEGILNADLFNSAKEGAYLINAARGGHLVEEDLIIAVDSGRLSGATLDVQREEPMAPEHPFWDHPKIKITPHIATIPSPEYAAPDVAENYRRLKVGEPLLNVIDVERQY